MTDAATAPGWVSPSTRDLDALLAGRVGEREPGLAVGVYRAGELVASWCAGLAVVEHGVPVTSETLFDIASASKHVTATLLLLLQREGRLDLDDDVRAYLPELALRAPVTLRQCLTHTGGLREYYTVIDISGVPLAGISERRLLRLVEGQRDLDFEPGAAFSYSNTGYVLAAAVIRRVTGRSVAELAQERIFSPLGMPATHFRDDLGVVVPGLANGYAPNDPDPGAGAGHHRADPVEEVVGDGGIVTSLRELAPWHAFLGTGHGLGSDIRDALLRRALLSDGTQLSYALGLGHITVGGRPAFAHTGGISGFRSVILCVPGERLGVSVLANRTDVYPALIARWLARLALGVPTGAGANDPVASAIAEAARPALLGRWHDPDRDLFIRLTAGPDGRIEEVAGSQRGRYALAADGRWYGEGRGVGQAYLLDDHDRLLLRPAVEDDDWGTYLRVPHAPPGTPDAPVEPPPAGTYFSDELNAFATIAAPAPGNRTPTIRIGLRPALPLEWVSADAYLADGWLTVRVADSGDTLLVSADGARRLRFTRVDEPAHCPLVRGLVEHA